MFTFRSLQHSFKRCINTSIQNETGQNVCNRNPRNLERLCIAYKPKGYFLDKPGREFWHTLKVTKSSRHITASVVHYSGFVPITASTREWAIRKHLYTPSDKSAYVNLARVLAQRCLETGITEMTYNTEGSHPGGKLEAFVKEFETKGITLNEPPRYIHPRPSDKDKPEKPWEVFE